MALLAFHCGVCEFKSDNVKPLRTHVFINHPNPYHCKQCKTKCSSGEEFKKHLKKKHEMSEEALINVVPITPPTPFHCGLCEFRTQTANLLRTHVHEGHRNPYHCPQCRISCKTKKGLQKHIRMNIHKKPGMEIKVMVKEPTPALVLNTVGMAEPRATSSIANKPFWKPRQGKKRKAQER